MNMPHEPLLEIRVCPLGPAGVFDAWRPLFHKAGYTVCFWRERRPGCGLLFELGHVQDIGENVWNYGSAQLRRKTPAGKIEDFIVREARSGKRFICLELAYVRPLKDGNRGTFAFLLRETPGGSPVYKSPLKLRREFAPCFDAVSVSATALG